MPVAARDRWSEVVVAEAKRAVRSRSEPDSGALKRTETRRAMPGWLEGVDPTNHRAFCQWVSSLVVVFGVGDVNKSSIYWRGTSQRCR